MTERSSPAGGSTELGEVEDGGSGEETDELLWEVTEVAAVEDRA